MNKISLGKNEVFSIKGVDGEEYLFDGSSLFLNGEIVIEEEPNRVSVIKSLRTEQGAKDWLKVAGFKYPNAQIMDTDTLKSYGMKDMDSSSRFHVVDVDDDEEENIADFKDLIAGEAEMDEAAYEGEPEEDEEGPGGEDHDDDEDSDMAVGQLSSILDNAQELRSILESETELEPWVQSKITLAADYLEKLHSYFEHHEGAEGEEEEAMEEAEDAQEEMEDEVDTQKGRVAEAAAAAAAEQGDGPAEDGGPGPGDMGEVINNGGTKKGIEVADPAEPSPAGTVFKSMHAAKQWNRYENPDKDRYYIDIMRSRDNTDPWTRSASLNAKYVVRDRNELEPDVIKGAHGNKRVRNSKIYKTNLPEKSLDAATKRVAAITQEKIPPVAHKGAETTNSMLLKNAEEAGKGN